MNLLGATVPLSGWTLLVLIITAVGALLVFARLARRLGWQPGATLLALLALGGALALTTTPGRLPDTAGWRDCLPTNREKLDLTLHLLGHDAENLLNLLLFAPLAVALMTASRSLPLTAVVIAVVPLIVEIGQLLVPGRLCAAPDYLANVLGGLAAALLTATARSLHRKRSPSAGDAN